MTVASGCPEEAQVQTRHSTGVVNDDEEIVFALIVKPTVDLASVEVISKSKLQQGTLSVCRSRTMSYEEMFAKVVAAQTPEGSEKVYRGYYWTTAAKIRSIVAEARKGGSSKTEKEPAEPIDARAICVIDDGLPGYPQHARLKEAKPVPDFWERNDRQAARGNLLRVFVQSSVSNSHASPPFRA